MKSKYFRLLCMLLCLTMLVQLLPASALAAEKTLTEEIPAVENFDIPMETIPEASEEVEPHILSEVTEERTENTKTFRMSDGTHRVAVYDTPVHYQDEQGQYQQIDNTFTLDTKASANGVYTNPKGNNPIRFEKQAKSVSVAEINRFAGTSRAVSTQTAVGTVSMEVAGQQIGWGYDGINHGVIQWDDTEAPVRTGDEAFLTLDGLTRQGTYENAFDHADLQYIVSPQGIKENIILKSPAAANAWTIRMNIGTLTAAAVDNQTVILSDEKGTPVLKISAPVMTDANGETSTDLTLSMYVTGSIMTLVITANREFLQNPNTVYPVTVDPYFYFQSDQNSVTNTFVAERPGSSPANEPGSIIIGYEDYAYGMCRGLLKLNTLPELPAGAVITDAQLMLYLRASYLGTGPFPVELWAMKNAWNASTVAWPGQTITSGDVIHDYYMITSSSGAGTYHHWEITELMQQWYEGADNHGVLLTSLEAEANEADQCVKYYSSLNPHIPVFMITYRNNSGLESYWTYHTQSLNGGTGYVNDYSGNLVFTVPVGATAGLRLPVDLNFFYNGQNSNSQYRFSDKGTVNGMGWMTNFGQRLEAVGDMPEYAAFAEDLEENGYEYVWLDSDGTHHFLKKEDDVWKDEDGIGLTLKINQEYAENNTWRMLEDKNGLKRYFSQGGYLHYIVDHLDNQARVHYDTNNSIKKIVDGAGNSIVCTYGGTGYSDLTLSSVQSPDGTTSFEYTNGNLTKITFKDGTSMSFTYSDCSGYQRLSSVTDRNGVKILYGYETSGALRKRMRVKTITEQADGITGRITNIDYTKHNCTTFTYTTFVGTLSETYQFSDWGHTTCVVAADGSTSNIRYNEFSGNDIRKNLAKNHTISEVSSSIRYINNLLVNHSVESGTTGWHTSQQLSSNVTFTHATDHKFLGSRSLKVVQNNTTPGKAGWYQWANITGGQGYTFSAYVKTNGVAATTGNGATLYLLAYDGEGTLLERKECEIKLTGNNDWQRLSLAYTAPEEATSLQLAAGLWNANGTAWFDCFQFESGVSPNAYNVLENSDFSTNTKWTGRHTESNDGIVSSGMVKLVGNPEIKKDFYQSIQVNKAGVAFTMSAKAKAPACPVESLENRAFAIAIGIIYADGTNEPCYIQFNPDVDQWQTMSFTAAPKKENWNKVIDHINIYVVYYNQENTAFFDDVMVTLDETGTAYTYDDEGNLITSSDNADLQTEYGINDANMVVSIEKGNGENKNQRYSYTYDPDNSRKLLTAKEDSTNTGYVYTYGTGNNSGNVTSVTMGTMTEQNTVDGSKSYIKTETAYTSNGAFVQSETDQRGNEIKYSLNATTGRINVVTDPLNNKTGYVYDDTTQYLSRVNAWNSSDQIVSSVFYEYFGPEYGGLLRKIQLGENYYYNFVYNAWADQQSVRINNTREMVYHSYNSNNGSLKKSTYGNGQSVEYIYDDYGRLSGEKVTNTSGGTAVQTSAYVYDALGRRSREKDYVNGHTSIYQYDIAGRLTRQINGQGSFLYSYDNLNRPDRMSFTFDGQSYLTTYDYLSANRPNRTDLVVGKVSRTYDNLQREIKHQVYSSDDGTTYLETTTAFIGVDGNQTTQLPRIYTTLRTDGVNDPTRPGGYTGFTYAYDANGNITAINESNGTTSRTRTYTYDALNRLKTDSDPVTGKTTTYTYDARGNILSKNISGQTVTYTYGDSTWKDLLTAYDGTSITYDAIGNPISYLGNTFTWQQGRQLASATTASGKNVTYRYNTDGIRIGKTVNGVNTEYLVDTAGAIHAMKQGNHTLIFMYDSTGRREGFVCYSDTYGDAAYYYLYNAQGDVIGLTDGSLNTVVQYTYDAWGKLISTTGSKANTIGQLNPFRYRDYVYDEETGLYYLQSRYYDPEVGRFLNADGYVSTGQGINGFNMFAYCGNNPILNIDPFGTRYEEYAGGGGGVGSIGGLIGLGGFGGGGGGNVGVIVSPSYYGYAGVNVQTPVGTIPYAGSAETISTPNPQQIYSSNEDTKEVYDFSKALKYFPNLSRKRTPHVHHIVPVGEFTNRNSLTQQQIKQMHKCLNDVGIDRVTDPMNLMLVSAGTHSTLHTNAYIAHVHEYIVSAAPTRQGVYGALFNLRIEIAGMDRFAMGY